MKKRVLPTPEEAAAELRAKELQKRDTRDVVEKVLDGLTPKQKKYAILCVTHPHMTDVERCELSGYSHASSTFDCLKKIDGKIGELLLAIGITGKDLALGIRDCMRATKPLFRKVPVYDRKKKLRTYEEKMYEVPDFTIRAQMIDLLARTGNYFPAKTVKGEHTHKHSLEDRHLQQLRDRESFLSKEVESNAEVVNNQSVS